MLQGSVAEWIFFYIKWFIPGEMSERCGKWTPCCQWLGRNRMSVLLKWAEKPMSQDFSRNIFFYFRLRGYSMCLCSLVFLWWRTFFSPLFLFQCHPASITTTYRQGKNRSMYVCACFCLCCPVPCQSVSHSLTCRATPQRSI